MWRGKWMTSCPETIGWGFWNLKRTVSWDSTLKEGSWFSGSHRGQTSSLRRGATRGGVRWKSHHRKKLCLSLLMSKNLKLKKVIKSFVPEPKKEDRKCFVFFGFLCIRVWTLWTFYACEYLVRIFGRVYVTDQTRVMIVKKGCFSDLERLEIHQGINRENKIWIQEQRR